MFSYAFDEALVTLKKVFTTAGSAEKRQFLIDGFGIPDSHVFDSRSSAFLHKIMAITAGKGVDVVLNCLAGDLLSSSWEVCAKLGRFVEVGKTDIVNGSRLDMRGFEHGKTFTAFDLTDLYYSDKKAHRDTWNRYVTPSRMSTVWPYSNSNSLLEETICLVRSGKVRPAMFLKTFPASEIVDAFRYFGSPERIGKVVVSLTSPTSQINVSLTQPKYSNC